MLVHTTASKLTAAAMAGGLVLASSAVVASGSTNEDEHQTVRDVFSRVGVDVARHDENAGTRRDERRGSSDAAGGETGKGDEVAGVATTTDESGRDKGAQISDVASDGTSRAGENGGSGSNRDAADSRAPHDPSHVDGDETGDEANGDAGTTASDTTGDLPNKVGAAADDATDGVPDTALPTTDLSSPR